MATGTMTPAGGGYNTFVRSFEASGKLKVSFSRNTEDWAVNRYVQLVPVDKNVGYYLEINVEEAGRILDTSSLDAVWPDGNDAPTGNHNKENFRFNDYRTIRYADAYNFGDLTVDQADWDLLATHGEIYAQRMMTRRTQQAVTLLTNTASYDSTHSSAVASITGVTGLWDVSTVTRSDIKRSINHAVETISQTTLGVVQPKDLKLVMSPGCARKISVSQEIRDFIKQSPVVIEQIEQKQDSDLRFGLPKYLYGVEVVIENTVKITSAKGATKAFSFVLSDSTPFVCSRPGGLEGRTGAPSFSTCTNFVKEEMTVESRRDEDNRRHQGRVVDDYDHVMTAPVSGFLFTTAVT
jgi:hypothetical protein